MPRCYLMKKNATKFPEENEESERKIPGPKSPTEATTAPNSPNYYKNLDKSITMANGYVVDYIPHTQDISVIKRAPVVASHDGGIPIFRERSAEETEAAHDLLELSRSLPPLPNPVVVRVPQKYEGLEKKSPKTYRDSQEESPSVYYDDSESYKSCSSVSSSPKPHIPVSVVVRIPSSAQGKNPRYDKSLVTLESPMYEEKEIASVICDAPKTDSDKSRPSDESLDELRAKNYPRVYAAYPEKPIPSLLPLVAQYRDEAVSSVICDNQCSAQPPAEAKRLSPIISYEESSTLGYDQSLSSGVAYEEDPNQMVITMSPPKPEATHVISRPIPTKVISMPDPSVPSHVVQFSHIVPNTSYEVDERPQSSAIESSYGIPSGSLLPPVAFGEAAESGTNFVSHTPVIRFQPSSEQLTESERPEPVFKPLISEYHSDAENNNPNSNKSVVVKKKRLRASFLPTDWKRRKTHPSETAENSGKRKYSCTQCGKKYATSSNLSRHKQTHRSLDSQSAKKCVTCGKAYVSMPALAMHLLTHKLSHACGVCGKMFSRPWLLQGHLRSHTGEKPYRCGHCGKAFADRSNLRAHMQTHSFEKNYICLKCKKSFALKSYLSKHLESSCLKENNDIEMKAGMESPNSSMDPIDVETWSKDGDVDDPVSIEIETDESMDEIVVV